MSRFADQCLTWKWRPSALSTWSTEEWLEIVGILKANIAVGAVVAADNVSNYYYAGNTQDEWDLGDDIPTLLPPFPSMFVECCRPPHIETGCTIQNPDHLPPRWGWVFSSMVYDPSTKVYAVDSNAAPLFETAKAEGTEPHWVVFAHLVCAGDRGGEVIGPLAWINVLLDEGGKPVGLPPLWMFPFPVHAGNRDSAARLASDCLSLFFPAALAISFMHCKNVAVTVNEPTAQEQQAHRRGHVRQPLLTYRTLTIEPMKQVLRREGNSDATGLKRALHICRGHFAAYVDKGLFGKYFGTFWIPAHVRGSLNQGAVIKDYNVKPPAFEK